MKSAIAVLIGAGSSWFDVAGGIVFVLVGVVLLTMSIYQRERQVSDWLGGLIFLLVGAGFFIASSAGSSWADVAMGFVFVLLGIVALLIGVFGKKLTFYSGDALTFSSYKRERQVPNWWGRLIFIVVGAGFIAFGMMGLFGRVSWSDN